MPAPLVLPRRDARLLLALTTILLVSTWPFFWGFTALSIAGGISLGLGLRWWHARHPVSISRTTKDRAPDINMSAIHVGGDWGGLVFVAGCVGILVVSLPPLRWFVALSLILAGVLAASVIKWRQVH
jgi:hypothetical protein